MIELSLDKFVVDVEKESGPLGIENKSLMMDTPSLTFEADQLMTHVWIHVLVSALDLVIDELRIPLKELHRGIYIWSSRVWISTM